MTIEQSWGLGERQGTSWTGHQCIAGLTYRDKPNPPPLMTGNRNPPWIWWHTAGSLACSAKSSHLQLLPSCPPLLPTPHQRNQSLSWKTTPAASHSWSPAENKLNWKLGSESYVFRAVWNLQKQLVGPLDFSCVIILPKHLIFSSFDWWWNRRTMMKEGEYLPWQVASSSQRKGKINADLRRQAPVASTFIWDVIFPLCPVALSAPSTLLLCRRLAGCINSCCGNSHRHASALQAPQNLIRREQSSAIELDSAGRIRGAAAGRMCALTCKNNSKMTACVLQLRGWRLSVTHTHLESHRGLSLHMMQNHHQNLWVKAGFSLQTQTVSHQESNTLGNVFVWRQSHSLRRRSIARVQMSPGCDAVWQRVCWSVLVWAVCVCIMVHGCTLLFSSAGKINPTNDVTDIRSYVWTNQN